MQANGRLRRPLWDVIKSIGGGGGHGGAHEQSRGIRVRTYPTLPKPKASAPTATGIDRKSERPLGRGDSGQGSGRLPVGLHGAHARGHVGPRITYRRGERKAAGAEGTTRGGKKEGEVAADESKTPDQATLARRVPDTKYDAEEHKKKQAEKQAEQDAGAFESIVQHAIAGKTDHKLERWPRYKADRELKPHYFNAYQGTAQHRLMKQARRWQNARERYGINNARNWRAALDLLDRATPEGEAKHKRRMETVTLGEGLHATWKKPAGEVVLEVMQRTGAHLQAVPTKGEEGTFTSVSLWGTPAQNEHARLLLPQFVEAADTQQRPVITYELKAEVAHDVIDSLAVFGPDLNEQTDTSYWREQEGMDDDEMELLEDALGDITNAPALGPAPIRAVWAPSGLSIRTRPTQWNQLTFAAYVDALTQPIPRLAQRKLYGPQAPQSTHGHVENMTAELVRVFTGKVSGPHASSAALDSTVRFFLKYNDFNSVRRVFLALEENHFPFTTSNYEAFFDVAAREESVPHFIYTLRLMISKGLRPTARTWTGFHLLMSRRFPLETSLVAEAMRRKGFFGNMDTVKTIAAGNVDRSIAAHLALGRNVEEFMQSCEARYGELPIWFSASFVNKMSRVLLEKGKREEALVVARRLEAIARERNRQGATTDTLNTFLASSLREGNIESALAYLRIFTPPQPSNVDASGPSTPPIGRFTGDTLAIQPDHITLGILFGLAWRKCHFNVARVIWRHACTHGKVSFKMQDAVRKSLRLEVKWTLLSKSSAGLPASEDSSENVRDRGLWNVMAGNFVVGISKGLPVRPRAPETESREAAEPTMFKPFSADDGEVQDTSGSDKMAEAPSTDGGDKLAELLDPAANEDRGEAEKADISKDASLVALSKLHNKDDGGNHRRRGRWAASLLHTDLNEAGSVEPVNLLLHDLERAWQIDVLWREEGLGRMKKVWQGTREREEESKKKRKESGVGDGDGEERAPFRQHVLAMFEEMLARGVKVPMKVGDIAGVREAEGLATVQYKP